jgi:hypothetical protein
MDGGQYRFVILPDPAPRTKAGANMLAVVITAALTRAGLGANWREK